MKQKTISWILATCICGGALPGVRAGAADKAGDAGTRVRVIQEQNGESTTVFSGNIEDFEDGAWAQDSIGNGIVLFEWDSDQVWYILPEDEPVSYAPYQSAVSADGIFCNISFMYNNAYEERVLRTGNRLTLPLQITNNEKKDCDLTCYLAEYDTEKRLLGVSDQKIKVAASKTVTAQGNYTFSDQAAFAGIYLWDSQSLQPVTKEIHLDQIEADYYADDLSQAQLFDISYEINGRINTNQDIDCIQFIPESTAVYNLLCLSTKKINKTLYDQNGRVISPYSDGTYLLTAKNRYYLKLSGEAGAYTLKITNQESGKDFDIYQYDEETNVYKRAILKTCEELSFTNPELSRQMYDDYESIVQKEAALHELPEFLAEHPKDLESFDALLNRYYQTKYEAFQGIRTCYTDLIDRYAALCDTPVMQRMNQKIYPISGKVYPEEFENESEDQETNGSTSVMTLSTPSFQLSDIAETSLQYKAAYPISRKKGNQILFVDFNTYSGLTKEKRVSKSIYEIDGQYPVNNLSPSGVYIAEMLWSTDDGAHSGGENSICRFVQMEDSSPEQLTYYQNGGRVAARMEAKDRALATDADFDTWLKRMDRAYESFLELTGYTPYRGKQIEMRSTREDLNEKFGITDGHNYWEVVFGYYDSTSVFKHSKAFTHGHMRRLSQNDWGDTPMHELSHVFDHPNWNFDSETLAQLKLYYVIEQLNARVYRPDRYESKGNGWYSGANYYDLLRNDRYLDSYDATFAKGQYSSEGFASVLIFIQRKIGWTPFRKTFRYFNSLPEDCVPQKDGEKLKLFLTMLKQYSGKDVIGLMESREQNITASHFGLNALSYVDPVYPTFSGGQAGSKTEISADSGESYICRFIPEDSLNYYIYTSPYGGSGTSNDTYLEVFDNAAMTGEPLASNDDSDGGRFSKVCIPVNAGKTYYVRVRNYGSGKVHAELNFSKNIPADRLTENGFYDMITADGDFARFTCTPSATGTYVFDVTNYQGGAETCEDTYLKLYHDRSPRPLLIANGRKKILKRLQKGETYSLQFSGYMMKYAKGRIRAYPGQTIAFQKQTDSSFIFVNSPEFITRADIIDDECHVKSIKYLKEIFQYSKLFEQKNATGKNTFYETHSAWVGQNPEYNPVKNFYMDVDLYNPTASPITVKIENLTASADYQDLQKYYNGDGSNFEITIQPYSHALVLESAGGSLLCRQKTWEWARIPVILFDFTVQNGQVTVSSLAAYDQKNLHLRAHTDNIVDEMNIALDHGDMIYDTDSDGNITYSKQRTDRSYNEMDLYAKMKGIARNESAWIDCPIDLVIDEHTVFGSKIPLQLKDSFADYGIAAPKWSWKSGVSPINNQWDGVLSGLPAGLHHFTYSHKNDREWKFDFLHRDLLFSDLYGTRTNVNDAVDSQIVEYVKQDMAAGQKKHFNTSEAPDEYAFSMGEWGATYHYTVTVKNETDHARTFYLKAWAAEHLTVGVKQQGETVYTTQHYDKIENNLNAAQNIAAIPLPANQTTTFEVTTMLGGGLGGLNHCIIIE